MLSEVLKRAPVTGRAALRRLGRERLGVYRGMFMKRLLQWPLRAVTRRLSRSVRRDPDLIAFGSIRNRFADNPAYLFLNMAHDSNVRCVWISGSPAVVDKLRSNGYDARNRWSISGIRVAMRASVYVYSFTPADINLWFSDGGVMFNTWHGVGVKKIERDRSGAWQAMYLADDKSLTAKVLADDRRPPDYLLTTSPGTTEYFQSPFGIGHEHCVELGYPRNDHLYGPTEPPALLIDPPVYERLRDEQFVVGYFPTWRYDAIGALPKGAPALDDIARIVGSQGGVVVFKPHHQSVEPLGTDDALVFLSAESDLNAHLGLCHVVITDYSSVAADFLILGRPIIIFAPDLEQGFAEDRFSVDPTVMQPGLLIQTADELDALLADIRSIPCADNFPTLLEHYWSSSSAHSADAVAAFIRAHARQAADAAVVAGSRRG